MPASSSSSSSSTAAAAAAVAAAGAVVLQQQPATQQQPMGVGSNISTSIPESVNTSILKPAVAAKKEQYPFWYGGLASMAAATVTHPLDLTKVRLQTAKVPGQNLGGMFVSIVRNEGFFAIYSGLSAALLRQGTYSTARFGAYDYLKTQAAQYYFGSRNIEPVNGEYPTPPSYILLPISMIAGAFGGIIGNPADIVNIRMQNDRTLPAARRRNYRNAIDGLIRIVREDKGGVKALYTGLVPNTLRGVLMTASQVVSYDEAKQWLVNILGMDPKSKSTHFSSSLIAGLVATTICSPVDVVKTRIMEGGTKHGEKAQSAFSILKNAVKKEGPGFMFRGWIPSFIRLGPQTILTFIVLEQLRASKFGMPKE